MIEFLGSALLALAIGGLTGLEREKSGGVLGTRTFALVSFLGFLLAFFSERSLVLVSIGLLGAFALAFAYYYFRVKASYYRREAIGLTTTFFLPLVFFLGVLVGFGYFIEAGIAAIASVYLLVEKKELHAFARTVSKEEIVDLLIFAIIAFIIYPQLPESEVSLLGARLSLKYFWLVVVLVSSISFIAHILLKYVHEHAVFYASILGGLISSLAAVTLFVKQTREKSVLFTVLSATSFASVLANVVLLFFLSSPLFGSTLPMLLACSVLLVVVSLFFFRREGYEKIPIEKHALSLRFSFEFALVFLIVSFLISALSSNVLNLFLVSFLSGAVSSTSVFAAIAYDYGAGTIGLGTAGLGLLLATAGSLASKSLIIGTALKDGQSRREIALLFSAVVALGFAAAYFTFLK